jgi:hypothetical protein
MSITESSVPSTPKITVSDVLLGLKRTLTKVFSVSTLFVVFKYIAFVGFTAISAILSVNMFSRLSTHAMEQFALVGVAITLEFFKIFSIVRGNTLWRLKLRSQAVRAYAMYFILAVVAIMASYGFTLTVINRNIEATNTSAVQIQIDASVKAQRNYQTTIASYEDLIRTNTDRLKAIPPDFTSAAKSLSDSIAKIQAQQVALQATLTAEQAKEAELRITQAQQSAASETTTSMFKLMADGFKIVLPGLTENTLMLFLLLLISVIIELGIISTSPAIPIDQKHLKHFLDEMSAHKAEELLAVAQGKKKKEMATKRLSFAGRIAQRWVDWKTDVRSVLASEKSPPSVEEAALAPQTFRPVKKPAISPSETTIVGSVPIRKPTPHVVVEQPVVVPAAIAVVEEEKAPAAPAEEVIPKDVTFPEPERAIPVRSASTSGGERKVVDLPRTPATPPMQVADTRTYRFGKTTEAVKDMFVSFVNSLFENSTTSGALEDSNAAAAVAGIAPTLATTFTNRLLEIKGSSGNALISKKEDGKLYPNYTREYIISYSTAEPSKERVR